MNNSNCQKSDLDSAQIEVYKSANPESISQPHDEELEEQQLMYETSQDEIRPSLPEDQIKLKDRIQMSGAYQREEVDVIYNQNFASPYKQLLFEHCAVDSEFSGSLRSSNKLYNKQNQKDQQLENFSKLLERDGMPMDTMEEEQKQSHKPEQTQKVSLYHQIIANKDKKSQINKQQARRSKSRSVQPNLEKRSKSSSPSMDKKIWRSKKTTSNKKSRLSENLKPSQYITEQNFVKRLKQSKKQGRSEQNRFSTNLESEIEQDRIMSPYMMVMFGASAGHQPRVSTDSKVNAQSQKNHYQNTLPRRRQKQSGLLTKTHPRDHNQHYLKFQHQQRSSDVDSREDLRKPRGQILSSFRSSDGSSLQNQPFHHMQEIEQDQLRSSYNKSSTSKVKEDYQPEFPPLITPELPDMIKQKDINYKNSKQQTNFNNIRSSQKVSHQSELIVDSTQQDHYLKNLKVCASSVDQFPKVILYNDNSRSDEVGSNQILVTQTDDKILFKASNIESSQHVEMDQRHSSSQTDREDSEDEERCSYQNSGRSEEQEEDGEGQDDREEEEEEVDKNGFDGMTRRRSSNREIQSFVESSRRSRGSRKTQSKEVTGNSSDHSGSMDQNSRSKSNENIFEQRQSLSDDEPHYLSSYRNNTHTRHSNMPVGEDCSPLKHEISYRQSQPLSCDREPTLPSPKNPNLPQRLSHVANSRKQVESRCTISESQLSVPEEYPAITYSETDNERDQSHSRDEYSDSPLNRKLKSYKLKDYVAHEDEKRSSDPGQEQEKRPKMRRSESKTNQDWIQIQSLQKSGRNSSSESNEARNSNRNLTQQIIVHPQASSDSSSKGEQNLQQSLLNRQLEKERLCRQQYHQLSDNLTSNSDNNQEMQQMTQEEYYQMKIEQIEDIYQGTDIIYEDDQEHQGFSTIQSCQSISKIIHTTTENHNASHKSLNSPQFNVPTVQLMSGKNGGVQVGSRLFKNVDGREGLGTYSYEDGPSNQGSPGEKQGDVRRKDDGMNQVEEQKKNSESRGTRFFGKEENQIIVFSSQNQEPEKVKQQQFISFMGSTVNPTPDGSDRQVTSTNLQTPRDTQDPPKPESSSSNPSGFHQALRLPPNFRQRSRSKQNSREISAKRMQSLQNQQQNFFQAEESQKKENQKKNELSFKTLQHEDSAKQNMVSQYYYPSLQSPSDIGNEVNLNSNDQLTSLQIGSNTESENPSGQVKFQHAKRSQSNHRRKSQGSAIRQKSPHQVQTQSQSQSQQSLFGEQKDFTYESMTSEQKKQIIESQMNLMRKQMKHMMTNSAKKMKNKNYASQIYLKTIKKNAQEPVYENKSTSSQSINKRQRGQMGQMEEEASRVKNFKSHKTIIEQHKKVNFSRNTEPTQNQQKNIPLSQNYMFDAGNPGPKSAHSLQTTSNKPKKPQVKKNETEMPQIMPNRVIRYPNERKPVEQTNKWQPKITVNIEQITAEPKVKRTRNQTSATKSSLAAYRSFDNQKTPNMIKKPSESTPLVVQNLNPLTSAKLTSSTTLIKPPSMIENKKCRNPSNSNQQNMSSFVEGNRNNRSTKVFRSSEGKFLEKETQIQNKSNNNLLNYNNIKVPQSSINLNIIDTQPKQRKSAAPKNMKLGLNLGNPQTGSKTAGRYKAAFPNTSRAQQNFKMI